MGIVTFKTKLSHLKSDQYLRCDVDYVDFNKSVSRINRYLKNYVPVFDTGKPITKADYSENGEPTEYIHLVVRNIKNGVLNLDDPIYINEDKGVSLSAFKIEVGDIVVAISANCGSALYFENIIEGIQLTLSHYLAKFKVDSQKLNPRLLVYYLNSKTIQKYFRATETGKTQKNLSKTYLRELPIFLPSQLEKQNELLEKIYPLELDIQGLKNSKVQHVSIINRVFGETFRFNWEEFETIKKKKAYTSSISKFANNVDCRFSCRFQHESATYLHNFLESITSKRVKHFLEIPIVLGSSISPKDFDEEGEYYYVSMATVKNFCFEKEDSQTVSELYAKSNLEKSVQMNDIIMTRSGVAIGKFALIENDVNGIFADFTMRIRLKGFDPLLAYYYFRSDFFQHLITSHKKGLQNQNIFPSQIKEFPIPDWDEKKQAEIVEAIKNQLDEQKLIDRHIEEKQQAINKIIEDAIEHEQVNV